MGTKCDHKGAYKEGGRRVSQRKDDVATEAEVKAVWGCKPRTVDSLLKLEKAKKWISYQSFQDQP